MSKNYAIITQKGGVGKTTTVNALAASFTKQGFKVLAVDFDPQGNLSFSTGADPDVPTIFEALIGKTEIWNCIQKTPVADVIPSNILLTGAELEFTGKNREFVLRNVLRLVEDQYDYILIDSPPGLGFLTINALAAARFAILPMLPDIFSLQGLVQVHETIEHVRKGCNPDLQISGILINKYNRLSKLHKEAVGTAGMIAENFNIPIFDTFIRNSNAISEAQSLQCNIFKYSPRCAAVKDYYKLSQEITDNI